MPSGAGPKASIRSELNEAVVELKLIFATAKLDCVESLLPITSFKGVFTLHAVVGSHNYNFLTLGPFIDNRGRSKDFCFGSAIGFRGHQAVTSRLEHGT